MGFCSVTEKSSWGETSRFHLIQPSAEIRALYQVLQVPVNQMFPVNRILPFLCATHPHWFSWFRYFAPPSRSDGGSPTLFMPVAFVLSPHTCEESTFTSSIINFRDCETD